MQSEAPARQSDAWAAKRLFAAWERIRHKHSGQEFDRADMREFGTNPEAHCALLSRRIADGSYRPGALHPVAIPKPGGARRLLLVPTLADRVVQAAVAGWLSPLCDPHFSDASHAYRPGRSAASAAAQVQQHLDAGSMWVVDADLLAFFDTVDHGHLLAGLKRRDWWGYRLAELLRRWLRMEIAPAAAAVFSGAACLCRGLPQGSPISPLLSNLFLDALDHALAAEGIAFVRFADDMVLLARDADHARAQREFLAAAVAKLGLALNDEKTTVRPVHSGFRFVGHTFPLRDTPVPPVVVLPADSAETDSRAPAEHIEQHSADLPVALPVIEPPREEHALRVTTPTAPPQANEAPANMETITDELLLRTLYLLESGVHLNRDGDAIVVAREGSLPTRVPAARLQQIFAFGAVNFSSGAISLCLERGIPVMLLGARGRQFGVIDPLRLENVAMLQAQFAALARPEGALALARACVAGKIANARVMLRRFGRRHPPPDLDQRLYRMHAAQRAAAKAASAETLRGHEGSAAAEYFGGLAGLLPAEWGFTGRLRRPPPDPVNSLLSYGYTVLYYNMLTLVVARGLNPYAGFYHVLRTGRHSLVADMVEEFRAPVVDAVVLDLVLGRHLLPEHFNLPEQPGDPCLMSDAARRALIHALEHRFNTELRTAPDQPALDMRRLMDLQVLQLCDVLRGRAATYLPFAFK